MLAVAIVITGVVAFALFQARPVLRHLGWSCAVLAVLAFTSAVALVPSAGAATSCGGNQSQRSAPFECDGSRVLDGSTFHVHIAVSSGGAAVVTITLDAPRRADTPVRARWHEGIAGPVSAEASTMISAGQVGPVTLGLDSGSGCGGQLDTSAVFVGNGQSRGRLAGPYIVIASCAVPTTTAPQSSTTPTTAPTTSAVATTAAPPTAGGAPLVILRGPQAIVAGAGQLPATGGGDRSPLVIGAISLGLGALLVRFARRAIDDRPGSRRSES